MDLAGHTIGNYAYIRIYMYIIHVCIYIRVGGLGGAYNPQLRVYTYIYTYICVYIYTCRWTWRDIQSATAWTCLHAPLRPFLPHGLGIRTLLALPALGTVCSVCLWCLRVLNLNFSPCVCVCVCVYSTHKYIHTYA